MTKPNPVYDPNTVEMRLPEDAYIETEPAEKSVSLMPILLFGVILLLIGILGALLWWGSTFFATPSVVTPTPIASRPTAEENNEPETTNAEAEVGVTNTMSTSDELSAIEADLFGTDIDGIDAELQTIDRTLGL